MDETIKKTTFSQNMADRKEITIRLVKATQTAGVFAAGAIAASVGRYLSDGPSTQGNEAAIEDDTAAQTADTSASEIQPEELSSPMELHTATPPDDDVSFSEAFRSARNEVGQYGLFKYKEHYYSTFLESEYEALTDEERAEYARLVKEEIAEMEGEEMLVNEKTNEAEEPEMEELPIEEETETAQAEVPAGQDSVSTATEITTQDVAYMDADGDGQMDTRLENIDDDQEAEIIFSLRDGKVMAFVDTENDGTIDALYSVNEEGKLVFVADLEHPFPAPGMPVTQYRDLQGDDGIIDAKLYDNNNDMKADRVDIDIDGDGSFSKAYFDTDSDGKLDMVADVEEDGTLQNLAVLNVPFEAPELLAMAEEEGINGPVSGGATTSPDSGIESLPSDMAEESGEEEEIAGLDDSEPMEDWD